MRNNYKKYVNLLKGIAVSAGVMLTISACDDFLAQDPLSFYEPDKTFTSENGLKSALAACDNHLRNYYFKQMNLYTEYMFSDMGVRGKTDDANMLTDISTRLTPTEMFEATEWFWENGYNGAKYANTIISYLDKVEGLDESVKNAYLGRAYFHRTFCYMMLTFQFNEVPLITKLATVPKQSYYSIQRKALLDMLVKDMEFAVEWVPSQTDTNVYGMVNKEACRQLLIKCYLATGQFEKAKEQADILIDQSGLRLMQDSDLFGTFTTTHDDNWTVTRNIIWDLHRPENKLISANKESILGIVCQGSGDSWISENNDRVMLSREFGSMWDSKFIMDPDGIQAVTKYKRSDKNYNSSLDFMRGIGRGICDLRPTWYALQSVWVVNGRWDYGDLRRTTENGNWFDMMQLKYNNASSKYYGKSFTEVPPTCTDTIRSWSGYPVYKIYIKDKKLEDDDNSVSFYGGTLGSIANWYVYRLAETYLLRAEANFYLGHPELAARDVNMVRQRAQCDELYREDASFTIGDIMDERARELYCEEFRHAELSRVSWCLAMSGKPDEWGNTYELDTYDKQEGTDKSGGSYWYQRIIHYNDFYNTGHSVTGGGNTYTYLINKHNLYYPVPNEAIKDNSKGELKQNFGYDGYNPDAKTWDNWEKAVADEDNVD